ncbi:MAG: DUF3179 domain-containing protein, partial [Nitrososphaerales archaeon]
MIAPVSVAAVVTLVLLMTFPIQLDKSTVTASNEDNNSGPLVPLEKIVSGGPPKDGIPSIDKPK